MHYAPLKRELHTHVNVIPRQHQPQLRLALDHEAEHRVQPRRRLQP
jgi:hypothetical protein